jgi:hypothetical protein
LFKHYERAKDENGEYIKFKNQNIDLTKTAGNYNLAVFQSLPQLQFIRKRLSEVKVFKRAAVKVLCDWVVTLPRGMEPEERRFFAETFKFLTNRYGQANVISAYVHRDETQPHLHFAFVPVTTDKKKNIQKVSAKEVLTRLELQRFHGDLDAYLTSVFGHSTGILNDATKDGNKSIDELKRGTAVKELKEIKAERQAEERRIDGLRWGDRIKPVKEKSDTVVITKADYQSANDALSKRDMLEGQAEEGRQILRKDYRMDNFRLQLENRNLQNEQSNLVAERNRLNRELARVHAVFNRNPKFLEEFLRLVAEMERVTELQARAAEAERRAQRQLEKGEYEM